MTYPEHEKLKAVKNESQAQGAFLEWLLTEKGYRLATDHVHTEDCDLWRGKYRCGKADELDAVHARTETLLAEFHGIDLNKLEEEKRAMIDQLQGLQGAR